MLVIGGATVTASPAEATSGTDSGTTLRLTAHSTSAGRAALNNVTLRAGRILKFDQITGQPSWANSAFARVQNAVWVFRGNGTFSFNTTNVRTDLYPLSGRYRASGNKLVFSANNSSAIGGSSAFTEMVGTIDTSARPPVMVLNWASGSGYGAVVNNQKFGSTASSAYRVTLTVVGG
jgi:hypothetical protein